ncbi:MAG: hypothetical protein CMG62_06795 [Candidatus Marinimicrobia bacterium]|nr:hypothetical protein [Candidatus Neomarinimicrobiota bacterium]|tara:strand:- start:2173 stop:2436 length:264 start_codon:yes stop_codon:yes gene_type:complete
MDQEKKSIIMHYIKEFLVAFTGVAILAVLLWYHKFNFSIKLLSLWMFIFNAVLFSFWLWKSKNKTWEKGVVGIYFILLEWIILIGGR